jgi:hypothetical protein
MTHDINPSDAYCSDCGQDVTDIISELETKLAEVKAENERMREVLVRINDASNHYAMTPTYSEESLRYAHQSTRNLARAALLGGE